MQITRHARLLFWQPFRWIKRFMPQGLYSRALLILILPMFILQGVLSFVFMERHWQKVTERLSAGVSADIALLVALEETDEIDDLRILEDLAAQKLGLLIRFLPPADLPPPSPKPFFDLLDRSLSEEIRTQVRKPFWIDTVGQSNLVEVRVKLQDGRILQVLARRSQTYASNSHIFLVWMVGSAFILLMIAIVFLRNQIRPIETLSKAAEAFGRGQPAPTLRPRGAREIRRAARAFIRMQRRIERQMEGRAMLFTGISHDLRTMLTRFRLQIALLAPSDDRAALERDVKEMENMVEAYLAYARGDSGENMTETDFSTFLSECLSDWQRMFDIPILENSALDCNQPLWVMIKPMSMRRLLLNLVSNAARHGTRVQIGAGLDDNDLVIVIDDDGPGMNDVEKQNSFKPFYTTSNGTGMGLPIARDIANLHGGDVILADSPTEGDVPFGSGLGGLRVIVRLPV